MALKGNLTTNYWTNDAGKTRGYTLEWSATQSVADNQSTISWIVKTAGTYPYGVAERTLKVSLGGKSLVNKTDRVMRSAGTVASGSFTLDHDTKGELNISGSIEAAVFVSSVNCKASGSWSLNKIARQAVITSVNDFTDEENPVINYSNPEGNGALSLRACISLDGENDDIPYREIDLSGTSYTFELTEEEREFLRISTVGNNSLTVYFILKTTMESIKLDDKVEKVFTVINAMPTLDPVIMDINETTIALTGNPNILVKEKSNAQVVSGATVYKGAGIKTEKIICGNQSLNESGIIENVGSGAFIFSLTDTRENTITDEVKVPLIEYVNLTCNLTAHAPDAEGDMNFTVSGNCFSGTFGSVDNEVLIYYRYRENASDCTEWLEAGSAGLNNNTYSLDVHLSGLDYQKKYTFQAMAVDKIMNVVSVERVVKTIPVFDWGENDFNFNVIVTIQGTNVTEEMESIKQRLGLSFTQEEGTNGIWKYLKRSNGVAMCYGTINKTSSTVSGNTTVGPNVATYYATLHENFPEDLFLETPLVFASANDSGSGVVAASNDNSTKEICNVSVWGQNSAIGSVNVLAIGRWKEKEDEGSDLIE